MLSKQIDCKKKVPEGKKRTYWKILLSTKTVNVQM